MSTLIQSGSITFNQNTPGWSPEMTDRDSGVFQHTVYFDNTFTSPPTIVLALNNINTQNNPNTVCMLGLVKTTEGAFTFNVQTFSGSELWEVGISWIAYVNG